MTTALSVTRASYDVNVKHDVNVDVVDVCTFHVDGSRFSPGGAGAQQLQTWFSLIVNHSWSCSLYIQELYDGYKQPYRTEAM